MRRALSILGVILVALGVAMYELLIQLHAETFRADIPAWVDLSRAILFLGAVFFASGLALPERNLGLISTRTASRYLRYATLANAFAAACFSIPVLVPSFEFPILITRWPGIYMAIGYSFFVLIGVLGTFAWSVFYRTEPGLPDTVAVYKPLFMYQFFGMEVGIYLMSVFMFLGGYVGSSLAYQGLGDTVVGAAMEFAVIPAALGIFLLTTSTLVGVTNAMSSRKIS